MKPPRILVLTLSFGSGHVCAAQTIADELHRQATNAEIRVIDAVAVSRSLFRAAYVWPYWAMVRYAPSLWDRFFARRVSQRHGHTAPEWLFEFGCAKAFQTISDLNPETIVATEVGACEIAAIAKRKGLTTARLINVITDLEAEPIWVQPEVDAYAVPDEHVSQQLVQWGASPNRIVVSGIPTAREFRLLHDPHSTRTKYQLRNNAPVVLL